MERPPLLTLPGERGRGGRRRRVRRKPTISRPDNREVRRLSQPRGARQKSGGSEDDVGATLVVAPFPADGTDSLSNNPVRGRGCASRATTRVALQRATDRYATQGEASSPHPLSGR